MTMPSRAYLEDCGSDGDSGVWGCDWQSDKDTQYIRADIAEELARAARLILENFGYTQDGNEGYREIDTDYINGLCAALSHYDDAINL